MTSFKLSKGDRAWIHHQDQCFTQCTVKDIDKEKGKANVFDDEYAQNNVKYPDAIFPVNPSSMDGVADNTELMHLHDPSLLHNIRVRYQRNEIYTYTAYILIAMNPYKNIDIYSDDQIHRYYGCSMGKQPPHIYAIADRAFRSMKQAHRNQSIVVSGESGAGKTVTCKHLMRFFAVVGGSGLEKGSLDELERKVLDSTPLLEAFGNAKTLRNNNSSRFGKFTEIHFSKDARVVGASIETYLLEKSRLVGQAKGERNFHVFYQLLAGSSATQLANWKISGGVNNFSCLSASGCTTVEGTDDAKNFEEITHAMTILGINSTEQGNCFGLLAGLLHLGNVTFSTDKRSEGGIVNPNSSVSLNAAAALLGLSPDHLAQKLLNRKMTAGGGGVAETYTIPLTEADSIVARDALAKHIYQSLFMWIVSRINAVISYSNSANYIGVLDISGFEIFEHNSFEQLCINFANEKIQQYFNIQLLQQEQEIYELEGLRWRKVEYEDNQVIINLFEARHHGVLSIIDEECVMPRSTDKTFTIKVHTTHTDNEFISKPSLSKNKNTRRLNEAEAFVVRHFAGEVVYETANFLDKNNDMIHDDLLMLLSESTNSYVKSLFVKSTDDDVVITSNRRFKSVGGKFNTQLQKLVEKLRSTTSHFIRCIKPNDEQCSEKFVNNSVMVQLRYSGMCAALILMQTGFPTRVAFTDLYERYKDIMPPAIVRLQPRMFCEALLVALDLHGGRDFQMGLTKVFFRSGKMQLLDDLTNNSAEAIARVCHKVKIWLAKKRFRSAIHTVRVTIRLGRLIEGVRSLRRFRRAVRFHVTMLRTWLPLVATVRNRLYNDAALAERKLLEERAAEEKRAAELKQKAEQERIRREEEEMKRLAEEKEQKRREEERRRIEEARKMQEDRIDALEALVAKLEEDLLEERLCKDGLEARISQLNATIDNLSSKLAASNSQCSELQEEVASLCSSADVITVEKAAAVDALAEEERARATIAAELKAAERTKVFLQAQLTEERASRSAEIQAIATISVNDAARLSAEKIEVENALSDSIEQVRTLQAEKEVIVQSLEAEQTAHKVARDEASAYKSEQANKYRLLAKEKEEAASVTTITITSLSTEKAALEAGLKEEKALHKTNVDHLTSQKATLEEQIRVEKAVVCNLSDDLLAEQDTNSKNLLIIERLNTEAATLKSEAIALNSAIEMLGKESDELRRARASDKDKTMLAFQKTKEQTIKLLNGKVAVIQALQAEKKKLGSTFDELSSSSATRIAELESSQEDLLEQVNRLEKVIANHEIMSEKKNKQLHHYENEKRNLVEVAIKAQEANLKLRAIYSRFKTLEELCKVVYGDLLFKTVMFGHTKNGTVSKQGGANQKKWQTRHLILNEIFLFYYESTTDKAPKGIVRVDQAVVERCDLSHVNKPFGIKLIDSTAREFFFSCDTEQERDDWVAVLSDPTGGSTSIQGQSAATRRATGDTTIRSGSMSSTASRN